MPGGTFVRVPSRRLPRLWVPLASGVALLIGAAVSIAGDATPPRSESAARLSTAPAATEYWDLTARFDGGYRLFERFLITNEGPGAQTAAATGCVVLPDGHVSEFKNGRAKGAWKLSPDRLRIDVASSALDLHAPQRTLVIDSTTQAVKITLHFAAGAPPAAGADPPAPAFRSDTLEIAAPIEGTVFVRGMAAPVTVHGTAALVHVSMDERESSLVRRRIEFVGGTPDLALSLSDIMTPSGTHRRWLALQRRGAIAYQSTDFELALGPAAAATAASKYPVPAQLHIRNGEITLDIRLERLLLRANPLDAVPQPFRFLLSRTSAPQRTWADASFHLRLAAGTDAPVEMDGQGILAVNFLSPVPLSNQP